jgi:translation initiation factor 2B subunit (eIF-2B alpha/beta/delta family)
MGLFWNLHRRFEELVHRNGASSEVLAEAAQSFLQSVRNHSEAAARAAATALPSGATVLVHSSSWQVRFTLLQARSLEKRFRLLCTISEPGREGIELARWAHAHGFSVLLLAEAQLGAFLPELHLFLIGSDALCQDGVVHKIGTALIAELLWLEHRPVWVLGCGEKLLPRPWGADMQGSAPRLCRYGIPQARSLYDCTPWEHISAVFTEHGMEESAAVRSRLQPSDSTPEETA